MRAQRVIFTALPQGFREGAHGRVLALLVFVSPRLYTDEGLPVSKLSQFPDFVDWPSTRLTWAVQFDGHPPVPADVTGPAPGPAAWAAVFSDNSYVEPYRYQSFTGRIARSYPHKVVRQYVVDLYTKIAAVSPESFPLRQALVAAPSSPAGELNPIAFGRTGSVAAGNLGPDSEVQALGAIDAFLNGNLVARAADLDEMAAASGVTGPPVSPCSRPSVSFTRGRRPLRAARTVTSAPYPLPRRLGLRCLRAGSSPISSTSTR